MLYGIVVGVWWIRLRDYFEQRGIESGVLEGNKRLAAIALTGHWCDITMGMVLIPISRHSALASFFKLSVATTLAFHMLTAYTLFALILLHGFLYVSWVPVFNSLSEALRMVFPVLNPTYLYNETWPGNSSALGVWRASLIFTGLTTTLILVVIFVTTLPQIRGKHFNLFYFTHLLVIVAVIIICLHASTMFYCTAPGLAMWVLDWGMRLYELRKRLDSKVTSLGNGWYLLGLQLPRHRLDGCACTSPLAHFYIHHAESSVRELHPFTTITHLASQNIITPQTEDDLSIEFLFRKRGKVPTDQELPTRKHGWTTGFGLINVKVKLNFQWTDKLSSLADDPNLGLGEPKESVMPRLRRAFSGQSTHTVTTNATQEHKTISIELRVEGPYFTPADPSRYRTVICFVAGTGVSGALAIASSFVEVKRQQAENLAKYNEMNHLAGPYSSKHRSKSIWERCIVFWSVREGEYVELEGLKGTKATYATYLIIARLHAKIAYSNFATIVGPTSPLEVHVNLTGKDRPRLNIEESLATIRGQPDASSIWVYLSGPNAFIEAGEKACKAAPGVEWYGARWDI
ncbi:hypothetical protein MMC30_007015 [Trapelia coarctata]|nr:hypothetical protein [Trapelia coarctata]